MAMSGKHLKPFTGIDDVSIWVKYTWVRRKPPNQTQRKMAKSNDNLVWLITKYMKTRKNNFVVDLKLGIRWAISNPYIAS